MPQLLKNRQSSFLLLINGNGCCSKRRCLPILCPQQNSYILIPEAWGLAAYWSIIAFIILAMIVNSHVVDLEDNLVLNRYGVNSLCVYVDDPPFAYFAATLYFPIGCLFIMFAFTKYWRVYVSFTENRISLCTKNFLLGCCAFEVISAIGFVQSFATTPYENEFLHAMPYVVFSFGLISHGISSLVFFLTNRHPKSPRWLFRYGVFSIVVLSLIVFAFLSGVINAYLEDDSKMWDMHGTFGYWYANSVMRFYGIAAFVLPMIFHYSVAKYVEDIKLDVSADLTDTIDHEADTDVEISRIIREVRE